MAWFIDWLADFVYRLLRYFVVHLTLGSDWLYKLVGRWQGMPPRPSARHVWRLVMWAREKKIPFEVRPIIICQRRAALQLLRRKYGVMLPKSPSPSADEEWQAWLSVLGKAPVGLRDSFLFMRVSLACGLGELAALYLCAELRNRYFVTMCSTMLLAGVLQMASIIRRRNEPIRRNLTMLALIVEELAELSPQATGKKAESSSGPSVTMQAKGNESDADSDPDEA